MSNKNFYLTREEALYAYLYNQEPGVLAELEDNDHYIEDIEGRVEVMYPDIIDGFENEIRRTNSSLYYLDYEG